MDGDFDECIFRGSIGFLKEQGETRLSFGLLAERYFATDPNTCLLKLRQLTEMLMQHLAARAGIFTSSEESQYDLLIRLKDNGLASSKHGGGLKSSRTVGH